MKIALLVVGKTNSKSVAQIIDEYSKRLSHYIGFELIAIADVKNTKNMTTEQQKVAEGRQILASVNNSDSVILLDEHGKEYTSVQFADFLQKKMSSGVKRTVFVVGGPYGFSQEVYDRADGKLSLSAMTFPHDLVRIVFVEQLYRAFTIINHEPYHHE